jgi:pimeloyl-ACP methyl ester carboxylesterase
MSLQLPVPFNSSINPGHQIHYIRLNPSAQHTILFCYGAGGSSTSLTLFQDFLTTHPNLGMLSIDRWVLSPHASSDPSLLSHLSSLTIELLSSLSIAKISVAAHSAGIYQALDLVNRYPNLITGPVFPIAAHIPAPYTASKIMSWMCTMPGFLFSAVGSIDQLSDTKAERLWLRLIGSPKIENLDDGKFVYTKKLRAILEGYEPEGRERVMVKERLDVDYRLGYSRVPGIKVEDLVGLYTGCKVGLVWFTCQADVFFGPASVERIAKDMKSCKVESVLVEGACHSDIYFRSEVWEKIYERVTTGYTG